MMYPELALRIDNGLLTASGASAVPSSPPHRMTNCYDLMDIADDAPEILSCGLYYYDKKLQRQFGED